MRVPQLWERALLFGNGSVNMQKISAYTPEDTFNFSRRLGEHVPAGAFIALWGEMGAGKTLFSQGFAAGLGVCEPVTSPTFTIVNEYGGGRLPLVHMDLFRLASLDEVWERGVWEYFDGLAVVLVEWPEVLAEELPEDRLDIRLIRRLDGAGEEWRDIEIAAYGEQIWLEEALSDGENFRN